MANQRNKDKVMVGVYIDKEMRNSIKKVLVSRGITITDFVLTQFYRLLKVGDDEILKKLELRDGRTKKSKELKKSSERLQKS